VQALQQVVQTGIYQHSTTYNYTNANNKTDETPQAATQKDTHPPRRQHRQTRNTQTPEIQVSTRILPQTATSSHR
jgi:hypothetical protein